MTASVFVTSGNGVVGHRVAAHLLKGYYPYVKVGARDLKSVRDLEGATLVEFDWEREETYANALKGVKYVFCSMPHHTPGWDEYFLTFLRACKSAGVQHIVKLSFYHAMKCEADTMRGPALASRNADPFLEVPLVQMHRQCDLKLIKSGIDYTILFPSHLMSNPLVYQGKVIQEQHKFVGASAAKGVNYVSPNDVAEVAVRILHSPKEHRKAGYTLTGPNVIKEAEVASLLSETTGEKIEYVDQRLVDLEVKDKPEWETEMDFVFLEMIKASGHEESANFATDDVRKICGHNAETYAQYLRSKDEMSPVELKCLQAF